MFVGCCNLAPDAELEGGSKEERRLEEGDRGGHTPKMGRSAKEGGGKVHNYCLSMYP